MSTTPTTPNLARFHGRIAEKIADNSKPSVVIVALGDSVTAGAGYRELLHEDVYHAQLKRMLQVQYPDCIFSVVNAGDNGQNATGGLEKFERDVPHHKPDLVIIGYGLNDSVADVDGLPAYEAAIETLIRRTREATEADLILLTSNMMPFYDNGKIPPEWAHVTELFLHLQNDGILAQYAAKLREVAARHNVLVADVYAAWEALEAKGVKTTEMLVNGLNHPGADGHTITAKTLFGVIENNKPE